jgi:16S rRNA (guanine527-N7)-methyltransferase
VAERGPGAPDALLDGLGLDPAAASRLARYLDLLAAWSVRINLTGARTRAAQADLLIRPVLALAPLLPPGRLVDVGSGNGSPGLVLAALRPEHDTVLLEPRSRRWAFLREAARAMELPRVEAVRSRHDGYAGPPSAAVTLRGLRLPLRELVPMLAPGGTVAVLGTAPAPDSSFEALPGAPAADAHLYRLR